MTSLPPRRRVISILTPVYNERQTIRGCYEAVRRVMETVAETYDYEHIFGDNCSTDGTRNILRELAREDPRVKVLLYSRNFGAEKSGLTLYRHASGDAVVGISADLQEPPEVIPPMIELWEQGNRVVIGVYRSHEQNLAMRAARALYYFVVDRLSPDQLPRNYTGFSLADRRVVDEVIRVDDHAPYLRGVIANVGFQQATILYDRPRRKAGFSKHRIPFLIDFAINGIISHSIVPIRLATLVGLFLSIGSFTTAAAYAVLKILLWEVQAPGATSVIVLILFFSGVQLVFLGILGEYLGAVHAQVRRKPFVVIDERLNFPRRRRWIRRPIPEPSYDPTDEERTST